MDPTKEQLEAMAAGEMLGPIMEFAGLTDDPVLQQDGSTVGHSWKKVLLDAIGADANMHWRIIGTTPVEDYKEATKGLASGNVPARLAQTSQYAMVGRICRMLCGMEPTKEEKEKLDEENKQMELAAKKAEAKAKTRTPLNCESSI